MSETITVMSYNIEQMKRMFKGHHMAPGSEQRMAGIRRLFQEIRPDIIAVVEAANKEWMHQLFLEQSGLGTEGFQYAQGKSRGSQDIVIYYSPRFTVEAIDEAYSFFDEWTKDIDGDGIEEVYHFERRPLEVRFSIEGSDEPLHMLVVMNKSKHVSRSTDFYTYERLSLGIRKRQIAEAERIRERMDAILHDNKDAMVLVCGDFNDDPGMDHFERILGKSSVEAVMGSVWQPEKMFTNVLGYRFLENDFIYTLEFRDRVMHNAASRKAWLDHILVSPAISQGRAYLKLVEQSGEVLHNRDYLDGVSDHIPIICTLEITEHRQKNST